MEKKGPGGWLKTKKTKQKTINNTQIINKGYRSSASDDPQMQRQRPTSHDSLRKSAKAM